MSVAAQCPVCLNANGGSCQEEEGLGDFRRFECEACGKFDVTRSCWSAEPKITGLSVVHRAALSHEIRNGASTSDRIIIKSDWLKKFLSDCRLPSPAEQASTLIRLIGDHMAISPHHYVVGPSTVAAAGALDTVRCHSLLAELRMAGKVMMWQDQKHPGKELELPTGREYYLSLAGWDEYEKEKRGGFSGRYGFIALDFKKAEIGAFVDHVVRPAVRDGINYDLVDMRHGIRAGIIDNIMRQQIRDSAFLIADLTHNNSGAYWEAGYAEGLGKPVIYICEKAKFKRAKTHFDTNHSTTVAWSSAEPESFCNDLVSTLRRSLNLFPSN